MNIFNRVSNLDQVKINQQISNIVEEWVRLEFARVPSDVKAENSAIFNLLGFNLEAIGTLEGNSTLTTLLTTNVKQMTAMRLYTLANSIVTIAGAKYVENYCIPNSIYIYSKHMSKAEITALFAKYSHIWVLPYIQNFGNQSVAR